MEFEIHITVKNNGIEKFIQDCKELWLRIFIRQLAICTDAELNLFYNKRYNII